MHAVQLESHARSMDKHGPPAQLGSHKPFTNI